MKTDSRLGFSWFNSLLLAIVIGLLAVFAAKAENNFDFDTLDGLFAPTQSARFFQAGREEIEREAEIFNRSQLYRRNDLLQINPELLEIERYRHLRDVNSDDSKANKDCK